MGSQGMLSAAIIAVLGLLLAGCGPGADSADFARWEAEMRRAGKLRADRAPSDAPFSAEDLTANFQKIGFGSEFAIVDGTYVGLDLDDRAPLTRWRGPLRYALLGRYTDGDVRMVGAFAERLGRITGLAIEPVRDDANLLIFILDRRGRAELEKLFRAEPDYRPLHALYRAWMDDPQWPCAAEFYYQPSSRPSAYAIYFAVVYIRAEVEGLSRRSCIEEEIAQTMGLARDDASLRPSIFNDDEEFALMTEHDAMLLRLLYDPRLEPGMTMSEAMPIVRRIARELRPAAGAGG